MKCNCCFCLSCSQKIDEIVYPFALLFLHENSYKSAWVTGESTSRSCVYTPIKNYFTLREAQCDLNIKEWIMKFRIENEVVYLPLNYIHSLNFVKKQRDCPGEIMHCINTNLQVHTGYSIIDSFSSIHNFVSTEIQHSFISLHQNRKRKQRDFKISMAEVSNINEIPFIFWTQELLDEYFSTERNVENDPHLKKILSVQYHSIGTCLYECEWKHPSGQTLVAFHRGGHLQLNKSYLNEMIKIKKKNPDRSVNIDQFELLTSSS